MTRASRAVGPGLSSRLAADQPRGTGPSSNCSAAAGLVLRWNGLRGRELPVPWQRECLSLCSVLCHCRHSRGPGLRSRRMRQRLRGDSRGWRRPVPSRGALQGWLEQHVCTLSSRALALHQKCGPTEAGTGRPGCTLGDCFVLCCTGRLSSLQRALEQPRQAKAWHLWPSGRVTACKAPSTGSSPATWLLTQLPADAPQEHQTLRPLPSTWPPGPRLHLLALRLSLAALCHSACPTAAMVALSGCAALVPTFAWHQADGREPPGGQEPGSRVHSIQLHLGTVAWRHDLGCSGHSCSKQHNG